MDWASVKSTVRFQNSDRVRVLAKVLVVVVEIVKHLPREHSCIGAEAHELLLRFVEFALQIAIAPGHRIQLEWALLRRNIRNSTILSSFFINNTPSSTEKVLYSHWNIIMTKIERMESALIQWRMV